MSEVMEMNVFTQKNVSLEDMVVGVENLRIPTDKN